MPNATKISRQFANRAIPQWIGGVTGRARWLLSVLVTRVCAVDSAAAPHGPAPAFPLDRNSATHQSTIRNETRMRMNTLVPMLGLTLASATASAQKVTYDYDKGTDFTKVRTYAWVHSRGEVQDELNHKRIVAAVDSQLSAKGLTKVQEGGMADVLVAYGVGLDRNLEIEGSSSNWGGPLYRGNRTG